MVEIAVVGCARRKLDGPAPADQLYIGTYFRACYRAARVIAPGRVFILSAKYGLLRPEEVIRTYDLRLGQLSAVDAEDVRGQALRASSSRCRAEPIGRMHVKPVVVFLHRMLTRRRHRGTSGQLPHFRQPRLHLCVRARQPYGQPPTTSP